MPALRARRRTAQADRRAFELHVPVRNRDWTACRSSLDGAALTIRLSAFAMMFGLADRHRMLRSARVYGSRPLRWAGQRLCRVHPQHAVSDPALFRLLRACRSFGIRMSSEHRRAARDGRSTSAPIRPRSSAPESNRSRRGRSRRAARSGFSRFADHPLHHPLSRAEGGLPGADQPVHPRAPRLEHRLGDRRGGADGGRQHASTRRHSGASRSTRSSRSSTS